MFPSQKFWFLRSAEIPPEPPLQSLHIPVTPSDPQPPFTHGIGFPEGTSATHKHWGDPAPLLAQVPLHFPAQAQRARHRRVWRRRMKWLDRALSCTCWPVPGFHQCHCTKSTHKGSKEGEGSQAQGGQTRNHLHPP